MQLIVMSKVNTNIILSKVNIMPFLAYRYELDKHCKLERKIHV